MLVAYRLAGLSALETYYAGAEARAMGARQPRNFSAHGKAVGDTGGRAVCMRSDVIVDDHHLPPSLASCGL